MHSFPQATTTQQPAEGDVVIIMRPNIKCQKWHLGKIERLNVSSDNQTRAAILRLANNKQIVRPICHLYPLEATNNAKRERTANTERSERIKDPASDREKETDEVEFDELEEVVSCEVLDE